jgi:hypothetical protein
MFLKLSQCFFELRCFVNVSAFSLKAQFQNMNFGKAFYFLNLLLHRVFDDVFFPFSVVKKPETRRERIFNKTSG